MSMSKRQWEQVMMHESEAEAIRFNEEQAVYVEQYIQEQLAEERFLAEIEALPEGDENYLADGYDPHDRF